MDTNRHSRGAGGWKRELIGAAGGTSQAWKRDRIQRNLSEKVGYRPVDNSENRFCGLWKTYRAVPYDPEKNVFFGRKNAPLTKSGTPKAVENFDSGHIFLLWINR